MLYHFGTTTTSCISFQNIIKKISNTHWVCALQTHKTKTPHIFEMRRAYLFASSPKSILAQTYVTWAPTSHWLTLIGSLHHNPSFNLCQHTSLRREETYPLASSSKSIFIWTYVTWVPTNYWLAPIGLLHPYQSFILCQSLILAI